MATLLSMLALMQGTADEFWTARGVPAACPTVVTLADLDARSGQVRLGGCAIELDRAWVRWRYATIRARGTPRRWKREDALQICLVVLHEEGHARGLPHTSDGLMADGSEFWQERPEECLRVVRPLIRSR